MTMTGNLRAIIVFAACGLAAACTTQEANPTGAGGSGGAGGGSSAGTSGGGTTGAGGLATNEGVLCLPPEQMITAFTYDADGGSMTDPRFGTFGTSWSGGGSVYGGLMSDLTGNDWHLSGTISDFSGFGLYFDKTVPAALMCSKVDASAFAGVRFTIWGSIPSPNQLTMGISTLSNAPPGSWLKHVNAVNVTGDEPGRCFPGSGMTQYYHPDCADAIHTFPVTGTQAAPQTISVMWNGFTGGKPQPNVMPSEIVGMFWYVSWAAGATPYAVDIHIDNLAFIPK
jgi:hypothetical protein